MPAVYAENKVNKNVRPMTITYKGKTQTIREWSVITGLPVSCIASRVGYNWKVAKILEVPNRVKQAHSVVYRP